MDVDFALAKFEALWAEAVDLSAPYVETIQRRTWLNDQISPYELYSSSSTNISKRRSTPTRRLTLTCPKAL